jgi:hypothetical protein
MYPEDDVNLISSPDFTSYKKLSWLNSADRNQNVIHGTFYSLSHNPCDDFMNCANGLGRIF